MNQSWTITSPQVRQKQSSSFFDELPLLNILLQQGMRGSGGSSGGILGDILGGGGAGAGQMFGGIGTSGFGAANAAGGAAAGLGGFMWPAAALVAFGLLGRKIPGLLKNSIGELFPI